jgi:hypothetical protein
MRATDPGQPGGRYDIASTGIGVGQGVIVVPGNLAQGGGG